MQKLFFVGKFNKFFEEVNEYLSQHFAVQVCVDNAELVKGMLKLVKPDLILISMLDMEEDGIEIFYACLCISGIFVLYAIAMLLRIVEMQDVMETY